MPYARCVRLGFPMHAHRRALTLAAAAIVCVAGVAVAVGHGGEVRTTTPPLPTGPPVSVRAVVHGLERPVQALAAPGNRDRLYVVEQAGLVRVVDRGASTPRRAPFLDLR